MSSNLSALSPVTQSRDSFTQDALERYQSALNRRSQNNVSSSVLNTGLNSGTLPQSSRQNSPWLSQTRTPSYIESIPQSPYASPNINNGRRMRTFTPSANNGVTNSPLLHDYINRHEFAEFVNVLISKFQDQQDELDRLYELVQDLQDVLGFNGAGGSGNGSNLQSGSWLNNNLSPQSSPISSRTVTPQAQSTLAGSQLADSSNWGSLPFSNASIQDIEETLNRLSIPQTNTSNRSMNQSNSLSFW